MWGKKKNKTTDNGNAGKDRYNKIGQEPITVKAWQWTHGGPLFYLLLCLIFSIIKGFLKKNVSFTSKQIYSLPLK